MMRINVVYGLSYVWFAVIWLSLTLGSAFAENVRFPSDAGVLNVRDFGAKGDGVTDDTAAFKKVFDGRITKKANHVTVYVPNGTYLLSDTISWKLQHKLQGQSREGTILRLKDNAPGYTDATNSKPVVRCFRGNNTSIGNFIQNLTVDTGKGNPGARGVDFSCHNHGSMREVTIRSGDGQGVVGLNMAIPEIGPCLVKNVLIDGFDYGIQTTSLYQATFEKINLQNQQVAGFENRCTTSIRGFESNNKVPAVINKRGMLIILDGNFQGGAQGINAIENEGQIYLRNLQSEGYDSLLADAGSSVKELGSSVKEYCSEDAITLLGESGGHLKLPIEETPAPYEEPISEWVRVENEKELRDAIHNGARTVYIPHQGVNGTQIVIEKPIVIEGELRRLIGYHNGINGVVEEDEPIFIFRNKRPVTFETVRIRKKRGVQFDVSETVQIDTDAPITFKSCKVGGTLKSSDSARGKLYFEDYAGNVSFSPGQSAWLRQYNPETYWGRDNSDPKSKSASYIHNNGANVWVFGMKTEGGIRIANTINGGRTELLGLWSLPNEKIAPVRIPMFTCHDAETSLSFVEMDWTSFGKAHSYPVLIEEKQGGTIKELPRTKGLQARIPLFRSATD